MQRTLLLIASSFAMCFGLAAQLGAQARQSQQAPSDDAQTQETQFDEPQSEERTGRLGYFDDNSGELHIDTILFGTERQLEVDDEVNNTKPIIQLPRADARLKRWGDKKARIHEQYGLQFALDHTILYLHATPSLGEESAMSQKTRLYGTWDLIDRDGPNTGKFIFKVESRVGLVGVAPQDLGTQAGYLGILGTFYTDDPINLTEFFWEQRFADGYGMFSIGHMYPSRYWETLGIGGPYDSFNNFSSLVSATYDYTPPAMTAILTGSDGKRWFEIGAQDANSILEHPTWFKGGYEFIYFAEMGYMPSWEQFYTRSVRVGGYYVDERTDAGIPSGWGVLMSGQYKLDDSSFQPYFRIGYADGGNALYRTQITGGAVWSNEAQNKRYGIAVSYQDPMVRALRDQITTELFVRIDLRPDFSIKANLQAIDDPALNTAESYMIVPGLSARWNY